MVLLKEIPKKSILSNIMVLYIEDEEFARIELSKFLRRRVGRLVVASDGEEGLDIIERMNPDIIITDLKMPGIDGLDMIREARKKGFDGGVIITSALSDSETILEALDIGIVKYIVKPVDVQKLLEYLNEVAEDIIKQKTGDIVLNHEYVLDRDGKKELEELLKGRVAYFIKKYTGKGPRNIRVFIQSGYINVDAEEVLTTFEQSIMSNKENYSLVEYNRKIFYNEKRKEFEEIMGEAVNAEVSLESVESDSKKNKDTIKFSFI